MKDRILSVVSFIAEFVSITMIFRNITILCEHRN